MCQGVNHFYGFLHHFVLAKLATISIRAKGLTHCQSGLEYGWVMIEGDASDVYGLLLPFWAVLSCRAVFYRFFQVSVLP